MLARCTIFGTYFGQTHINVIHLQRDDVTNTIWFNLATHIAEFWIDWHRLNVDGQMHWNMIRLEDRAGVKASYDTSISLTGVLGPSHTGCPFIAACFLFKTGFGGRAGRGRYFQGGYGHGSNFIDGTWAVSTQDRLNGVADELTTYWMGTSSFTENWSLCIANRDETLSGHDVIEIVGRPKVSTMNSRKIGRGA